MTVPYTYWNLDPLTNMSNSSLVFVDTARELNTQLNGYIGFYLVLVIWFVLFLTLKGRGESVKSSFAATSVISAIAAIILYPLGLIYPTLFWVSLILPAIGLFLLYVLD